MLQKYLFLIFDLEPSLRAIYKNNKNCVAFCRATKLETRGAAVAQGKVVKMRK
jgi:hypothetical protein